MESTAYEDIGYGGPSEDGPLLPSVARIEDTRPTPDQLYLAEKISDLAPQGRITLAGLQRLNTLYGVSTVTDALRMTRGFPPSDLRSAYGYVDKLCKDGGK